MFEFLFRRKPAEPVATPAPAKPVETVKTETRDVAPGTQLHFDPHLIAELKTDHGRLVALYSELVGISGQRASQPLTESLTRFGDVLRGHVLKENVRLYVYLKHNLQSDEDSIAIMQEFAHEMHQIGRAVTDFLHRYTKVEHWDDAQWAVFDRELGAIGKVLTRRIETEENTLYPLYLPPGDYR